MLEVRQLGWSPEALERVRSSDDRHAAVRDYFGLEAELLDEGRVDDWIADCLDEQIEYYMPSRASRGAHSLDSEFSAMPYFDEDMAALRTRASRLHSELAWAEIPPSRTRRHITNVRLYADPAHPEQAPGDAGELWARSYLFLVRSRLDRPTFEFLSCERFDTLVGEPDALRLRRRHIFVDQSCLGTINLAVFL